MSQDAHDTFLHEAGCPPDIFLKERLMMLHSDAFCTSATCKSPEILLMKDTKGTFSIKWKGRGGQIVEILVVEYDEITLLLVGEIKDLAVDSPILANWICKNINIGDPIVSLLCSITTTRFAGSSGEFQKEGSMKSLFTFDVYPQDPLTYPQSSLNDCFLSAMVVALNVWKIRSTASMSFGKRNNTTTIYLSECFKSLLCHCQAAPPSIFSSDLMNSLVNERAVLEEYLAKHQVASSLRWQPEKYTVPTKIPHIAEDTDHMLYY